MGELEDLQLLFRDALDDSPSAIQVLQSRCGDLGPEEFSKRFAIYRTTIRGALHRVLDDCYLATRGIVGERYFRQLAQAYIAHYPISSSPDCTFYGESFVDFLLECMSAQLAADRIEYLPDVARLDRAYYESYYSPTSPKFDFQAYASAIESNPMNIIFLCAQSLRVVESTYPLYEIWNLGRNASSAEHLELVRGNQTIVICRSGSELRVAVAAEVMGQFLKEVSRGATTAELCVPRGDSASASHSERQFTIEQLGECSRLAIQEGWISSFAVHADAGKLALQS